LANGFAHEIKDPLTAILHAIHFVALSNMTRPLRIRRHNHGR